MFGYLVANKPELKIKEYDRYRSYYCGLCHALKEKFGPVGQLTLSYDMTFLVVLLTALYEPESTVRQAWCAAHPLQHHEERINEYSRYTADMNLLLTYYKLVDDWQDEKKIPALAGSEVLKHSMKRIREEYPEKAELVRSKLQEIRECEKRQDPDMDLAAGLFGEIMGELFVYQKDMWETDLRTMGFFLGKFIYLMDAYDDREKDRKTGNYNVFLLQEDPNRIREKELLTLLMASCAAAFERLPILEEAELLRNIIYSGVWTRYCGIQKEQDQKQDENPKKK